MSRSRINFTIWIAVLLVVSSPLAGEKISFKISYNTASVSKSDLNTWIESSNTLWQDWQSLNSGQLNGELSSLKYGPKYEAELRIPLFLGLAFNLCGSHFSKAEEGDINLIYGAENKAEKAFIRNEVRGIPIKIGFSYSHILPFLENLYIFAGVGRHITFLKYRYIGENELRIGNVAPYVLKQDFSYNSEALGFYATLGAEYDLIKQIAVVIEAEKVWSKADGFKGSFETDFYDPFEGSRTKEEGKASLYFYDKKHGWSNTYYSSLVGHKTRPEDPEDYPIGVEDIQNLRQGEFSLSTFSIKIGIRFKF